MAGSVTAALLIAALVGAQWNSNNWAERQTLGNLTCPGNGSDEDGSGTEVRWIGFSPDGTSLVIAGGKYLTLWDTSTWAEAHCINTSDTPAKAVFSPDGARIYTVSGGGRTNVYNSALVLQNEWVIVDSQVPNLELNDVDISPDGQLLAIGTRVGDPCTWLLNALTGAVARLSCEVAPA